MARLKKAIAKTPQCDRPSSDSVFSAPLWFVKKSDRLQNLQRAIALFFLCVLCGSLKRAITKSPHCDHFLPILYSLRLCDSLNKAIACKISTVRSLGSFSKFLAIL
ncbi:hypothetical protein H6G96_02480 [Nostoc sp. FACHB-892]|uniref:hypothetical protein n=1 Tax=Nostoc sp. FACHB-892 TaxID=2692843 RepID=UPI001684544B|nr:hypothetical protein [Nostoc sp. FACHB-892]MBD2725219.1 hypothetical protein [Nostoc sp. FACHB-892]